MIELIVSLKLIVVVIVFLQINFRSSVHHKHSRARQKSTE